jgi:hypothetical protein
LSTAISRHSTAYNLLQTTTVGAGGLPSGVCTQDPRHIMSPAASVSGMATAGLGLPRGSQPVAAPGLGGAGVGPAAGRCVIPLYSPSAGTRDPSSILDTEPSLPVNALIGGVAAAGMQRTAAASSVSGLTRPSLGTVGSAGRRGGYGTEDSPATALAQGNANTSDRCGGGCGTGTYRLSGMVMSTGADLSPWFASNAGTTANVGGGGTAIDPVKRLGPAVSSGAAPTGPAGETGQGGGHSTALAGLTSTFSEGGMLVTCGRDYVAAVDDLPPASSGSARAGGDTAAESYRIPMFGGPPAEAEQYPGMAKEPSLGDGHSVPSVLASAAAARAAAAPQQQPVSAELFTEDVPVASAGQAILRDAAGPAAAMAAACSNPAAASASMSLHSGLLPGPPNSMGSAVVQTRGIGVGSGLYGRALAMAGEDGTTPVRLLLRSVRGEQSRVGASAFSTGWALQLPYQCSACHVYGRMPRVSEAISGGVVLG